MTNIFTKWFKKQPITGDRSFSLSNLIPQDRNSEGLLRSYGEIGWWHAGLFQTALSCAEVKWTLFDTSKPEKPVQIYKHKALSTLKHINPFQTSNEFIALHVLYMDLVGESFWVINYDGNNEPGELVLAYPNKMTIVPDKYFPMVKGYVYGSGKDAIPLLPNEVIHFKYPNPLNQYRGMGAAQAISVDLDNQKYSSEWNRKFWFNSARPDLFLIPDGNFSEEQFDEFIKKWRERYQGVNKAHQVALVQGIKDVKTISTSAKDMDFSNLQLRNRDIILGIIGMPQSSLGISENVNKANAEAGEYQLARRIIKPRLDWTKAKLQEQYIPKFKNSANLELGFEEVVPETIEQKRDLAESGMRAGYLTVNEARKTQGLDPIPNGDVLLVPLNLIPTPINGKPPEEPEETPKEEQIAESWSGAAVAHQPHKLEAGSSNLPSATKSLTPDQKRLHWEAYAKKTERQEEVFKKVFENVFREQQKLCVAEIERVGQLPSLNDEDTAKRFEAAIELVYHDAFESAI